MGLVVTPFQKTVLQITLVPRLRKNKQSVIFSETWNNHYFLIYLSMVFIGSSTERFAGVGLAVPRLGNVRLRLHFLRRGTKMVRICDNSVVDDAVYFPYLIVPALGIDSKIEHSLILAPNPAISSITLSLRNSNLEIQKLSLLSLAGKELIVPVRNIEGDFELNIEELASGVYFIKVQLSDNTTVTKRFIKQ